MATLEPELALEKQRVKELEAREVMPVELPGKRTVGLARHGKVSLDGLARVVSHVVLANLETRLDATWHEDLDAMLALADIVTIHTPLNADSRDLIDARRLALMKPSAFLINASRGGIVDEEAMVAALQAGRLAGAGLDVWRFEPEIDPRLLALPNVVMTPHMGSATYEGRQATGERVIQNIRMWADGIRPQDQVLEGWA